MSALVERRVRAMTVAALVGLSGVIAWGGASDALGAQAQPNACRLLSRKDAERILGKPVRRETNLAGSQASSCSYVAEKDPKRVVGLAAAEFPSDDEASKAYTKARANAQFDGLEVENVRRLGQRAHWLPQTNNFERTVLGEKIVLGELTVLNGRRVYTVYVAPPSKKKAREAISLVIAD
ncbi:MAG: hypothetical protein M3046_02240 [Actinomycetota bacterium]|nr:hypothetical protein [Actinomycetota bacterium]